MTRYRYAILEVELSVEEGGELTADADAALDVLEGQCRVVHIETNNKPMFDRQWAENYPTHFEQRQQEGWT